MMLFISFCVLFAAGINYQKRDWQQKVWQENQDVFYFHDAPSFTTTDAPYFLGLARYFEQTRDAKDYGEKRNFPNKNRQLEDLPPQTSLRDFPLLSIIISKLSPDTSAKNLLITGNALIPIFGFVMALGIVLAFGASGFWLEGTIAATGAGICYAFLVRSSIGRIDTDILNLGFFYAVLGLTIFAARAQSWRASIIWAVLAGLMLNLFFWWYEKAFMGWAFAVGLIWLSFMTSRDWRRSLVLFLLFVTLSGLIFQNFSIGTDTRYFKDVFDGGNLIYPNTFSTITELRVIPFEQILMNISGSVILGLFGVIGLAIFALRYPVLAVVYGPASVFALANFLIGNRAIFYSAPMLWFGAGFLALMMVKAMLHHIPFQKIKTGIVKESILCVSTIALLIIIYGIAPTKNYVPKPTFSNEVLRTFAVMSGNLPEDAVIATWWDYGYTSMLLNDYATFHDGGVQTTPTTHYVARALLAPSQAETSAILKFLAAEGQRGIAANAQSLASVEKALIAGPQAEVPPIFLVLTEQMGRWMGSISNLGMWDVQKGMPIEIAGYPVDKPLHYSENKCQAGNSTSNVICNNMPIDLARGTVAGQPILRAITQSKNGNQIVGQGFNEAAFTILHLSDIEDAGTKVLSFHERLGQSTFHRLFHLGQAEPDHFELVYDDYPHSRIYKIK